MQQKSKKMQKKPQLKKLRKQDKLADFVLENGKRTMKECIKFMKSSESKIKGLFKVIRNREKNPLQIESIIIGHRGSAAIRIYKFLKTASDWDSAATDRSKSIIGHGRNHTRDIIGLTKVSPKAGMNLFVEQQMQILEAIAVK